MGSSCTTVQKKTNTTILNIDAEHTSFVEKILGSRPSDDLTINISNFTGNSLRNSVAVGNGFSAQIENKSSSS